MAPIIRGRGETRGMSGRGGGRGRGRGRGGQKFSFKSTRLQELPSEVGSGSSSENKAETRDSPDILSASSDEEEELASVFIKPYSALLQSLKSNERTNGPARKKRKLLQPDPQPVQNEPNATTTGVVNDDAIGEDINEDEKSDELEDEALADSSEGEDQNDDAEDHTDLFESHFSSHTEGNLALSIKAVKSSMWPAQRVALQGGWKAIRLSPRDGNSEPSNSIQPRLKSIQDIKLKQKLQDKSARLFSQLDDLQSYFAGSISGYEDVMFCESTSRNSDALRSLTCLHVLNHVLKTRNRVIKNSTKLAKANTAEDIEYRDQGFTRPKVLFLLPTRQSCVKFVESIISLYEPEQQENKKRFQEAFSQTDDSTAEDKAEDFLDLFGGNDDDMFRLGLKFTRKTVKLFSQFYGSDIIFASPLGLRMAIGSEQSKKQDHDFLSSVEVIVVDRADALLMQNWEHVEYIFEHLNLQPKEAHGCDFSRVRNWYLDGNAKFLRQTIVSSAFNTPEINTIFSRYMLNVAGRVKISKKIYEGTISELGIQLRQTFSRFDVTDPAKDPEIRFKYFTNSIVPILDRNSKSGSGRGLGVLLFIPSYLDFVRVRNFLANSTTAQNISFASISEYTSVRDVARARSHFFSGRHSVLLYTGRAHHFRRYRIRGAKKVILYALPDNPIFYKEIAGEFLVRSISEGTVDPNDASCRTIFSKWDALKLERVVGTKRCGTMLKDKGGDTFDFM